MAPCTKLHLLLLFFFFFFLFIFTHAVASDWRAMLPALESSELQSVGASRGRRLNGAFRICALCTCCGGPKGLCLPSPCCYAINCHIPNRPFGYCAFTPRTCNCLGCHL